MDQRTRRNDMTDWWGWVDVYKDGAVDVGEYGEQLSGNGLEITSHDPPEKAHSQFGGNHQSSKTAGKKYK